jgi:hypothetical protein
LAVLKVHCVTLTINLGSHGNQIILKLGKVSGRNQIAFEHSGEENYLIGSAVTQNECCFDLAKHLDIVFTSIDD